MTYFKNVKTLDERKAAYHRATMFPPDMGGNVVEM